MFSFQATKTIICKTENKTKKGETKKERNKTTTSRNITEEAHLKQARIIYKNDPRERKSTLNHPSNTNMVAEGAVEGTKNGNGQTNMNAQLRAFHLLLFWGFKSQDLFKHIP